jgi:hypothetical protein
VHGSHGQSNAQSDADSYAASNTISQAPSTGTLAVTHFFSDAGTDAISRSDFNIISNAAPNRCAYTTSNLFPDATTNLLSDAAPNTIAGAVAHFAPNTTTDANADAFTKSK